MKSEITVAVLVVFSWGGSQQKTLYAHVVHMSAYSQAHIMQQKFKRAVLYRTSIVQSKNNRGYQVILVKLEYSVNICWQPEKEWPLASR